MSTTTRSLPWAIDRLFDRWWDDFGLTPVGGRGVLTTFALPSVDVQDEGKHIIVSAELPGMDEEDIDVSVGLDRVILRGEKKQERDFQDRGIYRTERVFGTVYREIELPNEVDADKAEVEFRNGVLTLMLPKREESDRGMKKIPIKAGSALQHDESRKTQQSSTASSQDTDESAKNQRQRQGQAKTRSGESAVHDEEQHG